MLKEASSSISPCSLQCFLPCEWCSLFCGCTEPSHLICSREEWSSMSSRNQWSNKVAVNRNDYIFKQLSKKTFILFLFFQPMNFCFLFPSREMWIICPASSVCFSASTIYLSKWKLPTCHLLII